MTMSLANKLMSNQVHDHLATVEAAAAQSDTNVLSVHQITLKQENDCLAAAAAGANLLDRGGDVPRGRD